MSRFADPAEDRRESQNSEHGLDDFDDLRIRTAEAAPMPEIRPVRAKDPGRTVRSFSEAGHLRIGRR